MKALLSLLSLIVVFAVFFQTSLAITVDEYCMSAEEQQFLSLINDYRDHNGLEPLVASQTLGASSRHHAIDIANCPTWTGSHSLCDGTTFTTNMFNHGYITSGGFVGENMAAGYKVSTPREVFRAWKQSEAHRVNMLNPNYHAIGVGFYFLDGSPYGWYWVTDFGGNADGAARIC